MSFQLAQSAKEKSLLVPLDEMNTAPFFSTYQEVIDWLFVQLPNYQAQGASAYKPGLDTIKALLESMGSPQNDFPSIHIAGTNGKGSTAHMLASVYQENDYSVGIFTSPHIVDFRERIKINGQMISQDFVLNFVNETKEIIDALSATFFEITTAMAFSVCAQEKVNLAIIETGLGGRLDSTNVLKPELSIITNIGIDHTNFLGDTLQEIAFEKAGIIKQNVPVLIGKWQSETKDVFAEKAEHLNAKLVYAPDIQATSDLKGKFQFENANTAREAVEILQSKFPTNEEKVIRGMHKVATNTTFMGRFQKIQDNPTVILDAAHNPAGIQNLLNEINEYDFEELHIVYGSSNDKDAKSVFEMFPQKANYYFTEFDSDRTLKTDEFKLLAYNHGLQAMYLESSSAALKHALTMASNNDLILVCGSFFVLENILKNSPTT